MKTVKLTAGTFLLFAALASTVVQSINWKLNEGSYSISFKGHRVEGVIKGLKTSIQFDELMPEKSKITASLDVNTINTGIGLKNKHAKSESGLNAQKYPEITFISESVTGKNGSYNALGKLTLKGVTKQVNIPFTFTNKGAEGIFNGKLTIVPAEYGITKLGTPENLDITITVPVTKQ